MSYKLYDAEQAIGKYLAQNTDFRTFCFDLLGKYCRIEVGEDYQEIQEEQYPCIVVNADRQENSDDINRSLEFSILLQVNNEKVQQDGYYLYPEVTYAEQVASEVYKAVYKINCGDKPKYYFEKSVKNLKAKMVLGKLEMIISKETKLGVEEW